MQTFYSLKYSPSNMSYKHIIKNKGNIKQEKNMVKVIKPNKISSRNKSSFLIEPKKPQRQSTIPELFAKK